MYVDHSLDKLHYNWSYVLGSQFLVSVDTVYNFCAVSWRSKDKVFQSEYVTKIDWDKLINYLLVIW